jgi:phosphatidylserine/phosphatidylglycerophosphate/cardiolipin synthase-like enzyme
MRTKRKGQAVELTLKVYVDADDALLLWSADQLDPNTRGFAIEREIKPAGKDSSTTDWLNNLASPGTKPYQQGVHQPSNEWPFRAFTWTDHSVNEGDEVRYRLVPVLWTDTQGQSAPDEAGASEWSERRTIGYPDDAAFRGYFNRGFVISQFVSRYLDEHFPGADNRIDALKAFKDSLSADIENTFRRFLGGDIRRALLALLDGVIESDDEEIYAALFELSDPELLDRLVKLGPRAHIVLANGSVKIGTDPATGEKETTAQARKKDENADSRAKLRGAHVDVEKDNRFVAPGALAHNKFLVVTDSAGKATRLWTGSTNWTTTGLCTQLNNALLVDEAGIANTYLEQWKALRAAASAHPAELSTSNSTPAEFDGAGAASGSIHFTRERNEVDLDALRALVNGAKEGILFLMFMPGIAGTLGDVEKLQSDRPDLVIRGVVSELPKGREDEKTGETTTLKVHLVGAAKGAGAITHTVDVVQPEGNDQPTAYWAAETTHQQFLSGIGYAIIHSKVLVIDPFSDLPTVVTGSHNFSKSASADNDENFIVIQGEKVLAEAYAVNVDSAWRHYTNRISNAHPDLKGIDYLNALLQDRREDEKFWRLAP